MERISSMQTFASRAPRRSAFLLCVQIGHRRTLRKTERDSLPVGAKFDHMGFEAFEQAIVSPALKAVARHWNDVRGAQRMPAWADIKPAAIALQLPIVWSYRYDRQTDTFTGRLAGERITAIFGKSFRGLPMTEAYPEHEYPALFARHKRTITEPAFLRAHGIVFGHLNRYGIGERVVLPLADDHEQGDGIFGATEYSVAGEPTREAIAAGEIVEWFALV
jgi:hypothetical protein